MSRDLKKKKKSTSKYRKMRVSPLIPIIAIVEVIILIGASTYAWFAISANKTAHTGIITVDADSGLDIDFKYANTSDTINIWNYIDDDFTFEPATSIDGRNIYFPTSGTFNETDTHNIVFREGTVNDVNSKYLSIDFELTNTSNDIMDVYLKNTSHFTVKDNGANVASKALRLAFYPNDGSKGDVRSNMFGDSGATETVSDKDMITIYYDNWGRDAAPYVYVWNSSSENSSTSSENTYTEIAAYPGTRMTHVGDSIYSFTFNKNYDMCIFNDGNSGESHKLTGNLYTINDQIYQNDAYHSGLTHYNSGGANYYGLSRSESNGVVSYSPTKAAFSTTFGADKYKFSKNSSTTYFIMPTSTKWSVPYAYIWDSTTNPVTTYRSWPGAQMNHVGADVYSYTYYNPTTRVAGSRRNYNYIIFNNGFQVSEQDATKKKQSSDTALASVANRLYYFNSGDSGSMSYTSYDSSTSTIYFYNTHGWTQPYIKATFGSSIQDVALATLTGGVYYTNIPTVYSSIYFYDKATNARTVDVSGTTNPSIQNGYIYRPTNQKSGNNYRLEAFSYDTYTTDGAYAVISPGVSAGFQRSYNPVVAINNASGAASQVVPAFSNSIDNYIYGSDNPMFTIEPNHMISLSLIVWLEGTDEDCTNHYAANKIDLYLEFTTLNRTTQKAFNNSTDPNYKYRFIDATREKWTSDRQPTASGYTVSPVIQLYDRTNKRGYLMKAAATVDYEGKQKVSTWECLAPKSIAGNDLEFRRVNPYNESEVWNYWYCGRLKNNSNGEILYPEAVTLATDETDDEHQKAYVNICTFTAFADGAPSPNVPDTDCGTDYNWQMSGAHSGAPGKSCGGLWGKFATTTLTMIDGTGGQSLSVASTHSTALTINYTYTYPGSGASVNIEYKASGPEKNTAYFFVIPTTILRSASRLSGSNITFKKYDNFDPGYAMNIPYRNSNISYAGSYPFEKTYGVRGQFGYIASTNSTYNYWGSDVLYIQAQHHLGYVSNFNGNCNVYVRFNTSSTDGTSSSGAKMVQVFSNSQYNITGGSNNNDHSLGYCCVIPCDRSYANYRIQRMSTSASGDNLFSTSSTYLYNATDRQTIDTHSAVTTGCYNNAVNKNICTMDYFKMQIFFTNGGWGPNYDGLKVHYWNSSSGLDNLSYLYEMYSTGTTNSYGQTVYQAFIPTSTTIQFISKDSTPYYSHDVSPTNGYVYYPSANSNGKFTVDSAYYNAGQTNLGSINVQALNNSPDWP